MQRERLLIILLLLTQAFTLLYFFYGNRDRGSSIDVLQTPIKPKIFQLEPVAPRPAPQTFPHTAAPTSNAPKSENHTGAPSETPKAQETPKASSQLTDFVAYQRMSIYTQQITEQITANPGKPYYFLVVGILSGTTYKHKRDACRETWLKYLKGTDMER